MIEKEFEQAHEITMNDFWCQLIEHCFAEDINEGFLTTTVNEGKTNETTLKVRITIAELDGKVLEALEEDD